MNAILSRRQSHNPSNMCSLHSCRDGKGSSILVTSRGAAPSLMREAVLGYRSARPVPLFADLLKQISFLNICRSGGLSSL